MNKMNMKKKVNKTKMNKVKMKMRMSIKQAFNKRTFMKALKEKKKKVMFMSKFLLIL